MVKPSRKAARDQPGALALQLTPGTLLSIKNFNAKLRPNRKVLPVNYWKDQAIGREAWNGKWAFETVAGTFSEGACTASGIKARENIYRDQTTPVTALARRTGAVFPDEAPNPRRSRQVFDWPLPPQGKPDLVAPKALRTIPPPAAIYGTGIAR